MNPPTSLIHYDLFAPLDVTHLPWSYEAWTEEYVRTSVNVEAAIQWSAWDYWVQYDQVNNPYTPYTLGLPPLGSWRLDTRVFGNFAPLCAINPLHLDIWQYEDLKTLSIVRQMVTWLEERQGCPPIHAVGHIHKKTIDPSGERGVFWAVAARLAGVKWVPIWYYASKANEPVNLWRAA